MGNIFDPGPDDLRLAQLVACGPNPENYQEAMVLYGKLAARVHPHLVARFKAFGLVDYEDAACETIAEGFEIIKEQIEGVRTKSFRFREPMSVATFLSLVRGNPSKPQKGGIVQKLLRRQRVGMTREKLVPDIGVFLGENPNDQSEMRAFDTEANPAATRVSPHSLVSADATDAATSDGSIDDRPQKDVDALTRFAVLPPGERLALDLSLGLSAEHGVDSRGLRARALTAGFKPGQARTIASRWGRAGIEIRAEKLTYEQIGVLLDRSSRSIGAWITKAANNVRGDSLSNRT